jgi:hypothetical protein
VNVRGSALSARVQWAKERGVSDYARWLNALSRETRNRVEVGFHPADWYPFAMFVEMNERLDELFGEGDMALCEEIGRYACDLNLKRFYRFLFKVGNVHFIIKRAAAAWRVSYDEGEMKLVDEQDNSCRLRIDDVPEPSRAHCMSVRGWVREAARISGTEMTLESETCRASGDDTCELSFTW